MANKTIHELSPATTVGSGYEFAIYDTDNNTTKKATVSDILSTEDLLYADDTATPTGEVDFSSQDTSLNPSSSVSVDLLRDDDSWSARFVKISQMFKNIRFLLGKLGTTDISSIGNGTVTGALSTLNNNLNNLFWIEDVICMGNGSNGAHYYNTPTKTGYTPIGIVGYSAIGGYEGSRGVYQLSLNLTNNILTVGWESAVAADRGLHVYMLYILT